MLFVTSNFVSINTMNSRPSYELHSNSMFVESFNDLEDLISAASEYQQLCNIIVVGNIRWINVMKLEWCLVKLKNIYKLKDK